MTKDIVLWGCKASSKQLIIKKNYTSPEYDTSASRLGKTPKVDFASTDLFTCMSYDETD